MQASPILILILTLILILILKNFRFITLRFRMLVNIHFQKYNRYNFLESYLYCNNGVWNLDREHLQ